MPEKSPSASEDPSPQSSPPLSPVLPKGKARPKRAEGVGRKLSINPTSEGNKSTTSLSGSEAKKDQDGSPTRSSSSVASPRRVGLPAASKPKANVGSPLGRRGSKQLTEEPQEEADDNKSHSDSDDEPTKSKSFSETMSLASTSNRRSTVAAKLIESVTSRWSHYTEKMVVQLIENEADVNSCLEEPWDRGFDDYVQTLGATTLHFAARRGLLEVCRALVKYQADPNSRTSQGISPIMVAVMFDQIEAIKFLFEAKASVLQQDQAGFCAVDLAVLEGKSEVLGVIKYCEDEEERIREEKVEEEFRLLHQDDEDEDYADLLRLSMSSEQWMNVMDPDQPQQLSPGKTGHVGGHDATNLHRSFLPSAQARADVLQGRKGISRAKTSALITSSRPRLGSDDEARLRVPRSGNTSANGSLAHTPVDCRSLSASPVPEHEDEDKMDQDLPEASVTDLPQTQRSENRRSGFLLP